MIYKRVGEKMRKKIDEYIIDSYYGEYKSGVFGKKKQCLYWYIQAI